MEGALPLDVPLTVELKVGADWDRMDHLEPLPDGGWRRVAASVLPEPDEPVLAEVGG
jgi:hypothetical protein